MKIIVPSIGRAGFCNSMKWLPETGRDIYFAVHHDEILAYKAAYPDCYTLALSDNCRRHTGLVRKEIIEQMAFENQPFIFVDDDIRISLKSVVSISDAFDIIENHMRAGATMAGLAPQLFSNYGAENCEVINDDAMAIRNKFVATVYGIDPTKFRDCPLEQLPIYEDIALVIHAIQHGNGTIVTYCATHGNVSPPIGGCNSYRSKEMILNSLNKLIELYPGICSIRETMNTTHNQYIGIGLRVAWSKIKRINETYNTH